VHEAETTTCEKGTLPNWAGSTGETKAKVESNPEWKKEGKAATGLGGSPEHGGLTGEEGRTKISTSPIWASREFGKMKKRPK